MNKKRGNVYIAVGLLVLIILLFATFLLYYQVNVIVASIRKDLYYATRNAILSLDIQELSYSKYIIDTQKAQEIVEELLRKNYIKDNGSITKIEILDMQAESTDENIIITNKIKVKFKSVINLMGDNNHEFEINETIKISLMEYNEGKNE